MNAEFTALFTLGVMNAMTIEKCRVKIDEIDSEILTLLDDRAAVVKEIAAIKLTAGLPITDREREKSILKKAAAERRSGKVESSLRIYKEILRESRNMQAEIQCEMELASEHK